MKRIHTFSSFSSLYEANETSVGQAGKSLGVDPTEKSKLYDRTLGMILTSILNSYTSIVSYPKSPYDAKIEPDLNLVKSSPLGEKVGEFVKIMDNVKRASEDNKIPGAKEAVDAWIEVGTKASEALSSIINQYKDQPEEQTYINDFINSYLDNYLKEIEEASKENELRRGVSSMTKESQEHLFEGILQGKKGMIEDVSKKITLVMAKLGSMANTPGMASEVAKLQSEVATIAAQLSDLLNKKNKDINKEDVKKADARLTEIPTILDKKAEQMLKQDSTNKEAASILVQALDLVKKAKEAENKYIQNKEEAEKESAARESSRSIATFSTEKIRDVNPDVKKFQELVISKLGGSKQISSLASFKKMGSDGKYGPGTKQMVEIVKAGFGLQDTSGETITGELMRELEGQEALKESRIFKFNEFSGFNLNEAFDVDKAMEVARKISPDSTPTGVPYTGGVSGGSKKIYKKGDSGNVVIAINRIVGQTEDEKNYTEKTVEKVKEFQKSNGMPESEQDGIVGPNTLKKLYDTRSEAKDRSVFDKKAPRGPWAYRQIAKILDETYGSSKKGEVSKGKGSNTEEEIQSIARDLIEATNGPGTEPDDVLSAVKRLKSKEDFSRLDDLLKISHEIYTDNSQRRSKPLHPNLTAKKIGLKFNSEKPSLKDMINKEMESDNLETVEGITTWLKSIGVNASYDKTSSGKGFKPNSFKIS